MIRYPIVIIAFIFSVVQIVEASRYEKSEQIGRANNCLLYCMIALFAALMVLEA